MARSFDHNGTQYVPFKDLVEEQGGSVQWDNDLKMATATLAGRQIQVQMTNERVTVDGQALQAEAPPFVRDDTLYVPMSLVRNLGI